MSTFQLPGLATGIDTSKMVQQLMIIESRRLARYQVTKNDYDAVTKAFDLLRTKINALKTAAGYISDSDELNYFNITSSDTTVLTASATAQASEGSHSVRVSQLATGETWIQDTSTFDFKTSYVGAGTFIYSYNYQEVVVQTTAETTLEDLVGLINNDRTNNPGVTASLLKQGGKYHLMLTGRQTGTDYHISINSSTTEVLESTTVGGAFTVESTGEHATLTTKITELDEFDSGTTGLKGDEHITISGKNYFGTDLTDLDMDVKEETTVGHLIQKINEHFDGVATAVFINGEIRLTDHISGTSGLEINLTYDAGILGGDTDLTLPTISRLVEGGVAGGLALLDRDSFIETQSAQDSKLKLDGYPLDPDVNDKEKQTLTCGSLATGGTFTLTYKGETTDPILHTATTTQIKDALVLLSTVEDGDITVGGTGLDQAGDTEFTFLAELGDVSMISIDATGLTFAGASTVEIAETTKGNDGWIHKNSNTVTDVLTGVTLRLVDVCEYDTEYEPIQVTISRNTSTVRSQVEGMVAAFNNLVDFLAEYTEYDREEKKMGILSNNLAVRLIKSQMKLPFIGVVLGFADPDKFLEARDIGLIVTGDGKLELDTDIFEDAVNQEKGFESVIDLLGAAAKGDSDSTTIEFYAASDKYTTVGTYDVKVTITGGVITSAEIKLTTESEEQYREADILKTNLFMGNSKFDEDGQPLYPENGLQITVKLTTDGDFEAKVRVKQGCVGTLEDLLVETVESGGRLKIAEDIIADQIKAIGKRIVSEEARLEDARDRLVEKFARLERTLAMLQEQLSAAGMLYSMVFGG